MRILLLGFGHVGRKLASLLSSEQHLHPGIRQLEAAVVGIVTLEHGCLYDPHGISLEEALEQYRVQGGFLATTAGSGPRSALDAVNSVDYDVLVELTTLSIEQGGEPALSYLRAALRRSKHVVCANKGPLAFAYQELRGLARATGRQLLFESTVMDGAPVFSLARSGLRGCTVKALSGILNSTTTYVLSQMERGFSLASAVEHAQQEGFAERQPLHDLEGWDAAAKICVLWNALADANITPHDVERTGITHITPAIAQEAVARSRPIRLLARAWTEAGRPRAVVGPEEIPVSDPLSVVSGTGAALRIETDCMNPILVMQEHPSVLDTAYGVLNDLLLVSETLAP